MGRVPPVSSTAVSSRVWPVVVAFAPLETAFPLATVCPLRSNSFLRNTYKPPRKMKAPTAIIGTYQCRTKRAVQRLTPCNKERGVHTQIPGENPVLALLPFPCLAWTLCNGAARTRERETTGRMIDSMDMIMKGWGTSREGAHSARIP